MASIVYGHDGKDDDASAADAGAQRPEASTGGEAAESMGVYVTPHARITKQEKEYGFLSCGIDTLDLSGYVNWGNDWPDLMDDLSSGKDKALKCNGTALFRDTCCGPLLITSTGKPPMFRFHLEAKYFHLYLGISSKPAGSTPNLYVSFKSRAIWDIGVRGLADLFRKMIYEMGGESCGLKPSRADLCADFLVPGGLSLSMLRKYSVPEDLLTCDIMQGANLETFYVGSPHAAIRARIYDKAKESIKHHKEWFRNIWKVEKLEDIWRVEFQLRREALKAYGLDTIDALLATLGGMWRDLSVNWFSLRLKDDSNTSGGAFIRSGKRSSRARTNSAW